MTPTLTNSGLQLRIIQRASSAVTRTQSTSPGQQLHQLASCQSAEEQISRARPPCAQPRALQQKSSRSTQQPCSDGCTEFSTFTDDKAQANFCPLAVVSLKRTVWVELIQAGRVAEEDYVATEHPLAFIQRCLNIWMHFLQEWKRQCIVLIEGAALHTSRVRISHLAVEKPFTGSCLQY